MAEIRNDDICKIDHHGRMEDSIPRLSGEIVSSLSDTFKALADPTRINILYNLSKRELCVCDLADILGMSQSAVSHQLRYLRVLRLVKNRREGNTVYYRHDDAHTMGLLQMAIDHAAHIDEEKEMRE